MKELFEQFCKEKQYLKSVSKKTLIFYRQSMRAYQRIMGEAEFSKSSLKDFVIGLRESGVSTASINCWARGINSFLSWLHENEYTLERLKIKPLKEEQKVVPTYSSTHLKAFVSYRPKEWTDKRLHTIVCVLIDTGARINEVLSLERADIDLENLLLTVNGKGNKERKVPMSLELRKVLYLWLKTHSFPLVFPTRDGAKLSHRNTLRDFDQLSKRLGVPKIPRSLHAFRHTFATEYLRSGGGELYLQKALGHTTLQMTRRYANLNDQDLKNMHIKTSLLSKLH